MNLNKMKKRLAAALEARAGRPRAYPARDNIEQELAAHRWAVSVLTQMLYNSKNAHRDDCELRKSGQTCTCEIGKLIRKVHRKLRR